MSIDSIIANAERVLATSTTSTTPVHPIAHLALVPSEMPSLLRSLIADKTGLPFASQTNIEIALELLGVQVQYDELANRKIIARDGKREIVQDHHVNGLRLEIERAYRFLPSKEFFHDVIEDIAQRNRVHPVRAYLDGLPAWDGVRRLDTWLIDYAGALDSRYVRAVSRLVLVAAVRRVRHPGAKFDEMLVLESPPGTGKSTIVASLCPDPGWFTDDLPLGADTKRQMESTNGKWIIEAGEMTGMSKADDNALKAYLSRPVDEARMAYGREPLRVPRQFIVIGTTNDVHYLKFNNTRRYWPVRVETCQTSELVKVREQLWAEACAYEVAGEIIRLDPALWGDAAREQGKRRAEDPIKDRLEPLFADATGKVRKSDVWALLGHDDKPPPQTIATEITRAMQELDWVVPDGSLRFPSGRAKAYVRGTDAERAVARQISAARCELLKWESATARSDTPDTAGTPSP